MCERTQASGPIWRNKPEPFRRLGMSDHASTKDIPAAVAAMWAGRLSTALPNPRAGLPHRPVRHLRHRALPDGGFGDASSLVRALPFPQGEQSRHRDTATLRGLGEIAPAAEHRQGCALWPGERRFAPVIGAGARPRVAEGPFEVFIGRPGGARWCVAHDATLPPSVRCGPSHLAHRRPQSIWRWLIEGWRPGPARPDCGTAPRSERRP